MRRMAMVCAALMVFALSSSAQEAPQKQPGDKVSSKSYIYQWTSDDGVVHITDDPGTVPKKYRSKAVKMEQRQPEEEGQGGEVQQAAPPGGRSDEEELDADKKAELQYRLKAARKRLSDAEQQYRVLEKKRTVLLTNIWSAPLPIAARVEAEKIAEEMKSVQQEIDDARHEIEVVIPEEARKNGVPPGWLRDLQ